MTEPARSDRRVHLTATALIVLATVVVLRAFGQPWWCAVGDLAPWSWDIWSPHNSQHVVDPYTWTHLLHGVVLYWILWLVLRRRTSEPTRFVIAMAIEALWEIVENTPMVIEKYREATISLDYTGDSVLNALGDLAACAVGFAFTAVVPAWVSLVAFVGIEIALIATIRDSLIMNLIMLLWPIEALKAWQMDGAGAGPSPQ